MSEALNFINNTFVYNFKESMWRKILEWNGILNHRGFLYIRHCPLLVDERFLCWIVRSTDLIFPVKTVLVSYVEEELWRERIPFPPIPSGEKLFMCIAEYKKQLCMISEIYDKYKLILVLWEFHIRERVWRRAESIPLPPFCFPNTIGPEMGGRIHSAANLFFSDTICPEMGGRGLWRFKHSNSGERRICIYDMAHHSWYNMGMLHPTILFEQSLFKLVI
jgi:hypothetical protein